MESRNTEKNTHNEDDDVDNLINSIEANKRLFGLVATGSSMLTPDLKSKKAKP
jgi:hypothetical protein